MKKVTLLILVCAVMFPYCTEEARAAGKKNNGKGVYINVNGWTNIWSVHTR